MLIVVLFYTYGKQKKDTNFFQKLPSMNKYFVFPQKISFFKTPETLKYRSSVLLRYAAQLTFAEIGQALHMPTATTKTSFQRSKTLPRAARPERIRPLAPYSSL